MEKKILTLTVSKQWLDMIVAGEKTEEYREIKPYWVARLFHNNSNIVDVRNLASALAGRTDLLKKYIDAQRIVLKQYTHVLFINGYRKDSPRIEKEIMSITIGKPKFQSTHPRGVRLWLKHKIKTLTMFQSTHPRGVRQVLVSTFCSRITVSIHAPTRGATSTFCC